jgi:hypothetical protein
MCDYMLDSNVVSDGYPEGYWDYFRECEDAKSTEDLFRERIEKEEYERERNRVW